MQWFRNISIYPSGEDYPQLNELICPKDTHSWEMINWSVKEDQIHLQSLHLVYFPGTRPQADTSQGEEQCLGSWGPDPKTVAGRGRQLWSFSCSKDKVLRASANSSRVCSAGCIQLTFTQGCVRGTKQKKAAVANIWNRCRWLDCAVYHPTLLTFNWAWFVQFLMLVWGEWAGGVIKNH